MKIKNALVATGFAALMCTFAISNTTAALAATCGNKAGGFESWKSSISTEAAANGVGTKGIAALKATQYATKTIHADRNQKSFKLSFDAFMKVRGGATIVAQGRKKKQKNAALFQRLEAKYGVPPGPLIAIWGMETAFGNFLGNQNTISAAATLAYDCRRSAFFTDQLMAALKLVDKGVLSSNSIGAMHAEVGQTQFLPKNVLLYGVDGDGNGQIDLIRSSADALASAANFLKEHGWRTGAGYQEGQINFRAIQGWNAAGVYQKAIAIMGAQIDQ